MLGREDLDRIHEQMARGAIKEFYNDLKDMTPEQIDQELREVSDKVDELTAWQEALTAAKRYGV